MNFGKTLICAAAFVAVPLLARAQDSAAPAGQPKVSQASAVAASPIDPARLTMARRAVDYVFPAGTYARIMGKSMDAVMGPMTDSMGAMPLSSLAGVAGLSTDDVAKLGKGTLADVMSILDPAYRERLQISTRVMTAEMAKIMSEVEPSMREALSRAYARHFNLAQLGEMNTFFATRTGRAYASESMTIMADPDVIAQMQAFVPVLFKRMPDVMTKVQAETANLPKPRKYEDLTPAEKARFDALVGKPADTSGK